MPHMRGNQHSLLLPSSFAERCLQVLYRFPAASPAPISDDEVAALAFPEGTAARPAEVKFSTALSQGHSETATIGFRVQG